MIPTSLHVTKSTKDAFSLQFTCLDPDEMRILSGDEFENQVKYRCLVTKQRENKMGMNTLLIVLAEIASRKLGKNLCTK